MKNKMLLSIIASCTLFLPQKSSGMPSPLERIPKRMKEYSKTGRLIHTDINTRGEFPHIWEEYDTDEDNLGDVRVLYRILHYEYIDNKIIIHKIERKPFGYLFDLNKDGKYSESEILCDPKKNGINGDEFWFDGSIGI